MSRFSIVFFFWGGAWKNLDYYISWDNCQHIFDLIDLGDEEIANLETKDAWIEKHRLIAYGPAA